MEIDKKLVDCASAGDFGRIILGERNGKATYSAPRRYDSKRYYFRKFLAEAAIKTPHGIDCLFFPRVPTRARNSMRIGDI